MRQHRATTKSRVNMTLDDDLVRRARMLTANLSDAVEQLPAGFAEQASGREPGCQRESDRHIDASNAFVAEHGMLVDEFPTLEASSSRSIATPAAPGDEAIAACPFGPRRQVAVPGCLPARSLGRADFVRALDARLPRDVVVNQRPQPPG